MNKSISLQYKLDTHMRKCAACAAINNMVYCELEQTLDAGGWMQVWQHSYMEDLPITSNMTFFSKHYKPCIQHTSGWCNVPNKVRLNYTEQMIVAYHNKQVVYAYKGLFNRNIDYDWTGAILIVHTKIIDRCMQILQWCSSKPCESYSWHNIYQIYFTWL